MSKASNSPTNSELTPEEKRKLRKLANSDLPASWVARALLEADEQE